MAASGRPTITDVAEAAGVSKGAVSFALNGRAGVSDETRARILDVATRLGWTPSVRARALSSARAMAVGLVIARPPETLAADPFFSVLVAGIETALSERGHALLLQVVPSHLSEEDAYRRWARDGRIDGVFLTDLRVDDPRPALLRSLELPAVHLTPEPHETESSVVVDDRPGITTAVAHLVDLGHTRVAHVGGPLSYVHGASRRAAWQDAMAAADLHADLFVESDFSAEGGAEATRQLLDRSDPPTAIVYANDLMATAGVAVAAARGLDVPGDLSVTGFDDTPVSAHLVPGLTTVRTDVLRWGAAAGSALLELCDAAAEGRAPSPENAVVHLPPPTLVVRGSTAAPRRSQ